MPEKSSPKIFFSYSETATADGRLVRRAVKTVKRRVQRLGWTVVDAMEVGITSVRRKVEAGLWDADACFVEATTVSPNVMFEVGFARALGIPTVFLVNPHGLEHPEIKSHFSFLGLLPEKPLPANLGDLEYLKYPPNAAAKREWKEFVERLDVVLGLLKRSLAPEQRLLHRNLKQLCRRALDFPRRHDPTHPLVGFVAGSVGVVADALGREGMALETDAREYLAGLRTFETRDHEAERCVHTITDLTHGSGNVGDLRVSPLKQKIAEQIFLIDWSVFFDDDELERVHELMARHAAQCSVRIGRKSLGKSSHGLFGNDTIGDHLLLMEPDLVSAYVWRGERLMVRVERSEHRHREGEAHYSRIRESTVPVVPGSSSAHLRRLWIEREKIGIWNPEWKDHENRSESYFRDYEQHIRCWIPAYAALIDHCAGRVQRLIIRSRATAASLTVLEIGYGTGALTRLLLDWIAALNAPLKHPLVSHYQGVDAAPQMMRIAHKRFATTRVNATFDVGVAPLWADGVRDAGPFDIVCGSLVLHDMVNLGELSSLADLLARIGEVIRPGGHLVFADVFTRSDPEGRNEQVNTWRLWMERKVGLKPDEIDTFFRFNVEMIETVTLDQLRNAAEQSGFDMLPIDPVPGSAHWSPCKVIALQKK